MLHDPVAYPEPFSFKPERFLDANGAFRDDPLLTLAFGFGRRPCPARHFVDSSLFIPFSCVLPVFRVGPPKDELGNEIPVTLKDSGTNSRYVETNDLLASRRTTSSSFQKKKKDCLHLDPCQSSTRFSVHHRAPG
jgi:hypothetical protein